MVLEEKTLQPFPLLLKKFFIGFFSRNRAAAFVRSGNLQVNIKESFFFLIPSTGILKVEVILKLRQYKVYDIEGSCHEIFWPSNSFC